MSESLIGVGIYSPREASRLLRADIQREDNMRQVHISPRRIARWLGGYRIGSASYDRIWAPEIPTDEDRKLFLGFRDLMELRTAFSFLRAGVSTRAIRKAVEIARELIDESRPLSTSRFQTDGRTIFLRVAEADGDERLLDLLHRQYAFKRIVDRSLKDVDFQGIDPVRWWPISRSKGIVIDPQRSFGQPIDDATGVPTVTLAAAARAEGGEKAAARWWAVPPTAVRRAVQFEALLERTAH